MPTAPNSQPINSPSLSEGQGETPRDPPTEKMRTQVDQLKKEATIERQNKSATLAELFKYVQDQQKNDPMINKGPQGNNPFEERQNCGIV